MRLSYDVNATKKPTNLSVNASLLSCARAMDINLSATLEQALIQELQSRRQQQWLQENRAAICAYNEQVEREGVFSDKLRSF